MSTHNRRRHHRNRKAARKAASLRIQFQKNPQFMARSLDQQGRHRMGSERRAILQTQLEGAPTRPRPAIFKPQRTYHPIPDYRTTKVQTISSPATTRQTKRGPSKAQREREERRATRRNKKPTA